MVIIFNWEIVSQLQGGICERHYHLIAASNIYGKYKLVHVMK